MKFLKLPGSQKLLSRILTDPGLPEKIRGLAPQDLAKLIDRVGLEDCGEIVALATSQQLERVFDQDVWRAPAPGSDEEFDSARFALWLEILLELGSGAAAEKISEMDSDFLTMAFSQLVWVVPFEQLKTEVNAESRLEKVMDSTHAYEIEDFVLFARDPRAWDAVLSLLAELDSQNHSFLATILERCAYVTTEQMEDEGGLLSVLNAEEQLKSDVAFEREKRREALGHVVPADARAFLKLASGPVEAEDHVSPAHFRELRAQQGVVADASHAEERALAPGGQFEHLQRFLTRDTSLRSLRMEELNYLANVIVSGGEVDGRSPRPGEAAQLVLAVCEKGLMLNPTAKTFIEAFRSGWTKSR